MPPIEALQNPKDKLASEIYSADMVSIGRYYMEQGNRISIDYDQIPEPIIEALVATEDVRFYDHSGIDLKALVRAFVKRGVMQQRSAGGGSTITQQLAKLLYSPTAGTVKERLFQKPIEWVIAVQLEYFYTKEEIVSMYFNKFDFLFEAVGLQSAAMIYFGKTPKELTVEEAAVLVGMCKNPRLYNPILYPDRSVERRNVVLEQMYKAGYLTQAKRDSLQRLPLKTHFTRVNHESGVAPYFREHIRQMMTAREPNRRNYREWQRQQYIDDSIAWETNPLYGWCYKNRKADGSPYNLYTDGLKIYSTIDSRMQAYAEEAVAEYLGEYLQPLFEKEKKNSPKGPFTRDLLRDEVESIMNRAKEQSDRYRVMKAHGASSDEITAAFETPVPMRLFSWSGPLDTIMSPMDSIRYCKTLLRTGMMSIDTQSGHVKAYVGGIDFHRFKYDMVSGSRRQVGSTIKPFLYTLAMEEGYTPCDLVPNVQPNIFDPYTGEVWSPRNSTNERSGEYVTLRWALSRSVNWVSAYLIGRLTPSSLVRLMRSFGIRGEIDPVMSLCLGSADVSVEEMVTAYTAFSNHGLRVDPVYVSRIEDNFGNVITDFVPQVSEVFSESTYRKMLPMLCDVIDHGTGIRLRYRYGIKAKMGGKTGTTNNNSDGWFMGFTPSLATGVWVGGEDRSIHFDNMSEGQGASTALPIYATYIQKVYADTTLMYTPTETFAVDSLIFVPCEGIALPDSVVEEAVEQPFNFEEEAIEGIFD
ncbi:MAG: transglycosylase domain-containing protein [Porphyromonadaceae bacterium]|nr:transglycosylase domain-containing protein [Porphyromonadaceae bacterium]